MPDIKIIEKPDSVSWETIRDVLQQAHQVHFDKGIVMGTTTLTAQELEQRIGETGICYVAMDGDLVVGTSSIRIKNLRHWYCNDSSAELTLQGVLPSFQGMHIGTRLTKSCEEEIRRRGFHTICFDTAAENTPRIQMALKDDYRLVDYRFNNGHYSVEMMKWLNQCPFSKGYCALRYNMKKEKVRLKHTIRAISDISGNKGVK